MDASAAPWIRAWKPDVEGVREVFHARFGDHPYPPHVHDTWTLFVVDDGAIHYDLDRSRRGAEPSMVSILPPHVVHDGRPATSAGYAKRVLYLEAAVVGEELIGAAVDQPVLPGDDLRNRVDALHDALACRDDALEAETRLAFIVERIRETLGGHRRDGRGAASGALAEELRAFLDAHLFEPVTIAAAARAIGAPPTQLARSFSSTFGLPPHAYVVGHRLEAARDRLLGGASLADVALETGFFDQAHLTRRFTRFLGMPPGRFRRGV